MIVRRDPAGWIVVNQADHARLAGEMIALVRAPELARSPRRAEILRAVSEHDNGWWEEDAAPRLDPESGGPLDFLRLPAAAKREVWRRGVERRAAREPYVAALVAGHALRLLAGAPGAPGDTELAAEFAARRDELLETAGRSAAEADEDDRWLRLGDELSLAAATLEPRLFGAPGWRLELRPRGDGIELAVAPFPWAGATRFALEGRRLSGRFADAVALGGALAAARRAPLGVRLVPAEPQPGSVANDSR